MIGWFRQDQKGNKMYWIKHLFKRKLVGINCSTEDGLIQKSVCLNKCFIQILHLITLQPPSCNSNYTAYGNYKNYVTFARNNFG